MTTDLESRIREALVSRGDAITPATLRRTAPCVAHPGEDRTDFDLGSAPQLLSTSAVGRRDVGRRALAWLSVAAVVALFATAVTFAVGSSNNPATLIAGGSPPDSISLLRTLHFALDLPAGYQLTDVITSADGTQVVQISAVGNPDIELSIDPPAGVNRHFASATRAITVAGRPGLIGSTWTDATVDSKTLSTSISWKYNDRAYAVFLNPTGKQATLLALARRIDFSKKTTVRVATAIHKLPAGTRLAVINSTYRDVSPDASYPWDSTIMLSLDSSTSDSIRVELCKCSSGSARRTAQKRTVNGKTAYIYPNGQGGADVEVDEGNGVTLHVSSSHNDSGRWTGTTNTLLELARSISVTPHPNQPTKWFDAATALP